LDTLKLQLALSVLIIALGIASVPFLVSNSNVSHAQASGFLIDFEEWNVTWTKMEISAGLDPFEALDNACRNNDYTYTVEDCVVSEINGVTSNNVCKWDLWTISYGSNTWVKELQPQAIDVSGYAVAAWAYRDDKGTPTVAVDETGRSIYGYQQAQRTVSLSPAQTEIIGSLRGVETLVGTDRYSNHPDSVVAGRNDGKIKVVGDFLNPSFEQIVAQRPDIVFCDGSLYNHHTMVERLRNTNINAVLMYGGESIQDIMFNVYIAGVAMGYEVRALEVLGILENAKKEITEAIETSMRTRDVNVMFALSPDKSPWITGSGTFIDDMSTMVSGNNVFSSQHSWVQINTEQIMAANPTAIIILTTDYSATQAEYDAIIGSLSAEWKATTAYKTGNIYLVCESAGEMSQCPSPRFVQLMEITARILHPEVFTDIEMPKFIGDDYDEYLTFTKHLDFNY
jgi:iron complex transport system substrate-binding protein